MTFSREDLEHDRARTLPARACPKCKATRSWYPEPMGQGCAQCGVKEPPVYFCTSCIVQLEHVEVTFRESVPSGAELVEEIWAHRCLTCSRIYISEVTLDGLAEFAATMPADLRILPELGIQTSTFFEIFVAAYGHPRVSLASATLPLKVAIQPQSELFQQCLNHITRWDTADYGHEMSSTLSIEPPPPYNDEQRRELQLLLSQLARAGETPLHFWTADFIPPDSDYPGGALRRLAVTFETWRLDPDRTALSLVSKVIGGSAQGPFINIFRLLELVLKRQMEDELARIRFDPSVSRDQFLARIRSLEHDLASRLRQRVQSLSIRPEASLQCIWALVVPERGYNVSEVFNHVAKLRNHNVHEPNADEALRLPWEELPFDELTEFVAELIVEIVEQYERDVTAAIPVAGSAS